MLKEIGEKTKVRTTFQVDILRVGVLGCDSKVISKTFIYLYTHTLCVWLVCLVGVSGWCRWRQGKLCYRQRIKWTMEHQSN